MPGPSTHLAGSGASWRACVTQLLQQRHLPAPSPGPSGSWGPDASFWRTPEGHSWHPPETPSAKHLDMQKPKQRWQKWSGARWTTEPTVPQLDIPSSQQWAGPFGCLSSISTIRVRKLKHILRLKGLRSLRTSRAKINKNQCLEQLSPCS